MAGGQKRLLCAANAKAVFAELENLQFVRSDNLLNLFQRK